jgi:hypothetical protein
MEPQKKHPFGCFFSWRNSNFDRRSAISEREAKLVAAASLGGGTGLTFSALARGFVRAKAADFFENAFGLEFVLEAFQGPVDGLTFLDLNFWHAGFLGLWSDMCGLKFSLATV